MYCNKCGQPIPDGSVFCNACGSKQAQPVQNNPQPKPQTTYCVRCGEVIQNGSSSCNYCGATQPKPQPQPQYRQVPPPQPQTYPSQAKQAQMPKYYYVDSWLLFGLCLAYGIVRGLIGFFNASERDMYKGIVACCAALIFIPGIKVVNNATVTLIIKLAIAIGVIIFI